MMNALSRQSALFLTAALTLSCGGCVTHTLLIAADKDGTSHASYTIEGDSLDVFDGRIPFPGDGWTCSEQKVEVDSSGNLVGRLVYTISPLDSAAHPIAPLGGQGVLSVQREDHWLFRLTRVSVYFPNWDATQRYGDQNEYLPEEIKTLEESGMDSTLTEEAQEELARIKARSQQVWAADRYLRETERLVRSQFTGEIDSAMVRDAVSRFAPMVRAQVMTLRGDPLEPADPRDVSLEWYPELREAMISAAAEATGLPLDQLGAAADSLEREYKRWLDLQDDTVQLLIVLPDADYRRLTPDPEESHGDTLVWTLPAETVAAQPYQVIAAGYDIVVIPLIIAGLGIGLLLGLGIRAVRRKS